MSPTKRQDINWTGEAQAESLDQNRVFRERGEQRYSLEILPINITFEVDRLRRDRDGLVAELSVSVGEQFKHAKTYNGIVSIGDINLSAVRSRTERANLIRQRSGAEHLDWHGYLEQFCIQVLQAERRGKPAVVLADVDPQQEKVRFWTVIEGVPILSELPMVLFGDAASGKSILAMYIAGLLANQGVNVLYADWEFSELEHRERLGRLFQPMPKNLYYVRCDTPLSHQVDRLLRLIREHKCQYLVCDSIGFAVDGAAESAEAAMKYFRALRQLNVGSLNLAHIPKQYDDSREATVYGSVFFKAGARSAWFVDRAATNPRNEIRFALHHRKSNVGELLPSRGFRVVFGKTISLEAIDVKTVDELATGLPLLERVKLALSNGAITLKQLSDDLGVPAGSVRSIMSRHKSSFVKMGNKIGLVAEGVDF